MAKQMFYADERGVEYPASYWKPVLVSVNKVDRTARVVFYGFVNKDAADQGKAAVGVKEYPVNPAHFDTFFGVSVLDPEGRNPYKAAYEVAMATLEGPAPEPYPDDDGNQVIPPDTRKSFFDGGLDV